MDGIRTYSRTLGRGRDVVLVHGARVSSRYWRPAQRALAATGRYRVHALDLPGFGRSESPPWQPDLPRLQRHLQHWLRQTIPGTFDLVGQSLGCEIAVRTALAERERTERLVLVAPAGLPHLRSLLPELLGAAVDVFREPWSLYPAIVPAYLRCGPRRLLRILQEQKRHDHSEVLTQVRQPTLVLRGHRDPVVTEARLCAVAALLPHASAASIPGAHGAHFQYPDHCAQAIDQFLRL